MLSVLALLPAVAVAFSSWDPESSVAPVGVEGNPWTYVPLTDPTALCLDGSAYGLALCLGTGPIVNWTFNFQGGGWCYSESECLERSFTPLGSSSTWAAWAANNTCYAAPGTGFAYHMYCDGASRTGFREEAWPVPGNASAKLFFRGTRTIDASMDLLFDKYDLASAQELTVTGGSAGGLTVFLNVDHIAERMKVRAPVARVVGNPVCGFFIDAPNDVGSPTTYGSEMAYVFNMQNSSGSLSPACQAHYGPTEAWRCIMAPYAAAFIETPWFAFQSRFDTWQLGNVALLPCAGNVSKCNATQWADVKAYGPEFMAQLQPYINAPGSKNGGFLDACLIHGSTTSSIDNKTNVQAFEAWLQGGQQWYIMLCDGSETAGPCDTAPVCERIPNPPPMLGAF